MTKIFFTALLTSLVLSASGQTPYIYFLWSLITVDSADSDQIEFSFNCGYTFDGEHYYQKYAEIQDRDSSFFAGSSKGGESFIYDIILTDTITDKIMIIRLKEPLGFIVTIEIGSIRFVEGYFEPELIQSDIKQEIYFSLEPDWNNSPIDFDKRKLETKQDEIFKTKFSRKSKKAHH